MDEITALFSVGFTTDLVWRFSDNKNRVKGRLIKEEESLYLEIKTTRARSDTLPQRDSAIIAIVSGVSRATLLNPFQISSSMSAQSKQITVRYKVSDILFQFLDSHKAPLTFRDFSGDIPLLNLWLDVNKSSYNHASRQLRDSTRTIKSIRHQNKQIELIVDVEEAKRGQDLIILNKNFVKISSNEELSYWLAVRYFRKIEDLINFVFTAPHREQTFHNFINIQGKPIVRTLVQTSEKGEQRAFKSERRFNLLFQYDDLDNISEVICNWIDAYDDLYPVIENLTFIWTTPLRSQSRLLTYINCLELLHTKFFAETPAHNPETYKDFSQWLKDNTPKEYAAIAGSLLHFGNHTSLLQRLQFLRDLAVNYGCTSVDDELLNKAKNTRNKATHNTIHKASSLLTPLETYEAEKVLGQYVKCVILHIIGVQEKDLKTIVEKSFQFQDFYRDGQDL